MTEPLRVLALQPYFGGSHAQFHNSWVSQSQHRWTTLKLPPRHWKWRMRHAAIHFAEAIRKRVGEGESWDVIFCTDMMNLAEFKGLTADVIGSIPLVIYFHENQFAYPSRKNKKRDQHFPFTNFISAVAADALWFNSQFNFDSMLAGLNRQSEHWPDFPPASAIAKLKDKVDVQPPGLEDPCVDVAEFQQQRFERARKREPIRIAWAARWEFDKNPNGLLEAIEQLEAQEVSFEVSVIGQDFRFVPPAFEKLKSQFPNRIRRWGFQKTRLDYWEALAESDVFVSTAIHEFFGISVAESILAGAFPLLPDRLSYPELLAYAFPPERIPHHLYDGSTSGFVESIKAIDEQRQSDQWQLDGTEPNRMSDLLGMSRRVRELDKSLRAVANKRIGPT